MSLPFNPTRRVLRCAQTASNLILHQIIWRYIYLFFLKLIIVSIFSLQCHSTFIFFIFIFSILVEFMMTCKPHFKFDIKWLDYMPKTPSSRVCVWTEIAFLLNFLLEMIGSAFLKRGFALWLCSISWIEFRFGNQRFKTRILYKERERGWCRVL